LNCVNCDPGYFCPKGSREQFICPPGHYCNGNLGNNKRTVIPKPCPAGSYMASYGNFNSACDDCPIGYFCKAGTSTPTKCPAGYICPPKSTTYDSTVCPAGKYSGAESIGSLSDCRVCPKGHYCPSSLTVPSVFPIPCPQGTYRASTGASLSTDCVKCTAGRVCPYLGNQFGDSVSLPCVPGHACPAGTKTFYEFACPAGTYSDLQNGIIDTSDITQCKKCPRGFACAAGTNTLTKPWVKCSPGYFCPEGSSVPNAATNKCPAGTWSDRVDLYQDSDCYKCPPGKYCDGGKDAPDGDCLPGSYCPGSSVSTT